MQNVRDKLDIKLSDETASQFATRPIQYETAAREHGAGAIRLPGHRVGSERTEGRVLAGSRRSDSLIEDSHEDTKRITTIHSALSASSSLD